MRVAAVRSTKAPQSARIPNIAIVGTGLPVLGSDFTGSFALALITGGGVTATASCTSSPVGLMAIIGARFSSTTTGASAVLIGSATSTGSSTAVNRTGTFVLLASSIAFAFG